VVDKVKLVLALVLVIAGVFGFYAFVNSNMAIRVAMVVVGVIAGAGLALTSETGKSAWQFMASARTEVRKVVWPAQKETVQSTMIVVAMVIVIGLYLWLADMVSFWAVYDLILGATAQLAS